MEINKVILGNNKEVLKTFEDNSVDSIVTDPPYEYGIMGKAWDSTGIAYDVELWKECLRVVKPGGYIMAFGSSRTHHRLMVAIEDAGFEIRDTVCWAFGSGFPKSHNIGKAVDKLQGNEREVVGSDKSGSSSRAYQSEEQTTAGEYNVTKGTSDFEGWGTNLKPAVEYICMARKPLSEKTVAKNCLKWGTGGINIDESRVGLDGTENLNATQKDFNAMGYHGADETEGVSTYNPQGRFPANLITDGSEEVRECFPDTGKSGKYKEARDERTGDSLNSWKNSSLGGGDAPDNYGDSGNASRYFKSIIYQAKASKSERNKGCEGLPLGEAPASARSKPAEGRENALGEPRANNHPTVKPLKLMEYLIKMVTPKGGIVVDPFAGSGSTLIAAKINGFKYIGIELEEEHIPIINSRLKAY